MWTKTTYIALAAIALLTVIGCASKPSESATGDTPQASAATPPKGGAELWAENCSRCHNIRPPQSYNDAQWATVVHHMRFRANLDGTEAKLIAEFLQASH